MAPNRPERVVDDPNGSNRRVGFADAGRATRLALERAATADPPLDRGEWKALATVIAMTGTFSKLGDDVALSQLSEIAGLGERELGRKLRKLAARHPIIIRYTPGRGSRSKISSRIGLPLDWSTSAPLNRGNERSTSPPLNTHDDRSTRAPLNKEIDRRGSGHWVARNGHIDRSTCAPLPEKSEKTSARVCPSCRSTSLRDEREEAAGTKRPKWRCTNRNCRGHKGLEPFASWADDPPPATELTHQQMCPGCGHQRALLAESGDCVECTMKGETSEDDINVEDPVVDQNAGNDGPHTNIAVVARQRYRESLSS